MYRYTFVGSILCILSIILYVFVAFKYKDEIRKRSDNILFGLFNIVIASSLWGLAAPRIGSSITLFRVSMLIFCCTYIIVHIKNKDNPFKCFKGYMWWLVAIMGIMLLYGLITFVFLSNDRSYTFSRLFNLAFDCILCISVLLYCRKEDIFKCLIFNITVNVIIQYILAIYECFTDSLYSVSEYIGPSFLGLFNLNLPQLFQGNTNNLSAAMFFCGMIIIIYWLNRLYKENSKIALPIILFILCAQWFISYAGGAILVQIPIMLFFCAVVIVSMLNQKFKKTVPLILIPLIFAIAIQLTSIINLNTQGTVVQANAEEYSIENIDNRVNTFSNETDNIEPKQMSKIAETITQPDDFTGLGIGASHSFKRTVEIRTILLRFAFETFRENVFGVGLGNTQKLAELHVSDKTKGVSKLHCYIAECIADFGIFFILTGCGLMITLISTCIKAIRKYSCSRMIYKPNGMIILLLITLICAVFLSTAPGCAQDLKAMWIYIGVIIIAVEYLTNISVKGITE